MEDATTCNRSERAQHWQKTISDLPDDLLRAIVSLLTMKEAARTSVLARRWRYLWICSPNLDFDGWEIILYHRPTLVFGTRDMMLISLAKGYALDEEREIRRMRFVNLVNQVVKLHDGKTIDQFRIRFTMTNSFTRQIHKWIKFAFAKRVKIVELDLAAFKIASSPAGYKYCAFPNICDPSKRLHLLPHDFSSFNRLEALCLKDLNVTGEVLEYFIANCPHLEVLHVKSSEWLSSLRVTGPSLRLKHLEIHRCRKITHLEISAPNLVSFTFVGPRISVCLKNAPRLVNLFLDNSFAAGLIYNFLQFNCCFTQMKTLTLSCPFLEGSEFRRFPDLPKLKKLVVRDSLDRPGNLFFLTSLINAAPSLHEFVLMVSYRDDEPRLLREVDRRTSHPHRCLKLIEVIGFVGYPFELDFAMYLLENAVSLEKMIIDLRNPLSIGWPIEFEETPKKFEARKCAELLKDKLPAGVDLIIR